jgi:hypothetical protein
MDGCITHLARWVDLWDIPLGFIEEVDLMTRILGFGFFESKLRLIEVRDLARMKGT